MSVESKRVAALRKKLRSLRNKHDHAFMQKGKIEDSIERIQREMQAAELQLAELEDAIEPA